MKQFRIRKDDKVMVIAGKDQGKIGMVVCPACAAPTRVGYRYAEDGKKIRFCKKCNETL